MDESMFHFKRRTLWIIIYVTIPLIFILNSLGPDPEPEPGSVVEWSLDELTLDCRLDVCLLPLEGGQTVRLSAVLPQAPVRQVPIPEPVTLSVRQQGGYVLATMSVADPAEWPVMVRFAKQWLPDDITRLLVSGAVKAVMAEDLNDFSTQAQGASVALPVEQPTALGVLESPPFGTDEQLAFLIWIEVLKQRLSGYQIEMTWDHRQRQSYALFNSTLSPDLFTPVSASEFQPVLQAYQQAAAKRMRSAEQLHRYASSALVYQVPFNHFVQQPERLAALTLEQINQMRESALGQITPSR